MSALMVRVPYDVGLLLKRLDVPGLKEDAATFHITMFIFEEDPSMEAYWNIAKSIFQVVQKQESFLAKLTKVTHFDTDSEKKPVICPVKAPKLKALREALRKQFLQDGVSWDDTFKVYKPHVTLSYAENVPEDFDITPIQWGVTQIELWGGAENDDVLKIIFPFGGSMQQKEATSQDSKLSSSERQRINADLRKAGFDGNGRFHSVGSALSTAFQVLSKYGIEPDDAMNAWRFHTAKGTASIDVARTNQADPFSPTPIRNSVFYLQWEDLATDHFEVVAYMS